MEQKWSQVKPEHELDHERLRLWRGRIAAALENVPNRVMAGEETALDVLGKSERAAAWRLSYRGECFLDGLVVWENDGWRDAANWAGVLAGDMRNGEHGGSAGRCGAERKHETDLPAMVTRVNPKALAEWEAAQEGINNHDYVAGFIASAFIMACGAAGG